MPGNEDQRFPPTLPSHCHVVFTSAWPSDTHCQGKNVPPNVFEISFQEGKQGRDSLVCVCMWVVVVSLSIDNSCVTNWDSLVCLILCMHTCLCVLMEVLDWCKHPARLHYVLHAKNSSVVIDTSTCTSTCYSEVWCSGLVFSAYLKDVNTF